MQSFFQLPKLYLLTTQAGSWIATSKATRHVGKQFLRAAASLLTVSIGLQVFVCMFCVIQAILYHWILLDVLGLFRYTYAF